ncbi:putative dinucleotide-binding enzyme [Catenulispora sp. MAP12-49]|uniref:NADPH-dependent F420 reductase n=1 Tax=Catenulispora sp. MAP12-49 TaxID=3156302 RepID=UPI003513CF2C
MRIGILGTGTLAATLGQAWSRAGHQVVVGGRSLAKAQALADRLGHGVRAAAPREAVAGRDAVLLAVAWAGVEDVLRESGACDGALEATPLIDPTNAVEHGVGVLLTDAGDSAAKRIGRLAPGAHVVKAFHLFPAEQWSTPAAGGAASPSADSPGADSPVTVAVCGDDPAAVQLVGRLVRDVGAVPAVFGTLDRVRQLEEVAGFVIGLAFAGTDPNSAIPRVGGAR